MIRAFLVEDEPKALELLKNYLGRIPFMKIVGEARDPMNALEQLQQIKVDVLFLDINLPNLSGMEFYKSLSHPPKVIFTTAYPEFAVQGFDLEAVDYLIKPITFPRFLKACNRLNKNTVQESAKRTASIPSFSDLVYIKSGAVMHKLLWRDIQYLEKDENYVIYHTQDKKVLSRQSLSDLEEILPAYFVRIHKSYAVSLLHIQTMEREQVALPNCRLPVGNTYRQLLQERVRQFQQKT